MQAKIESSLAQLEGNRDRARLLQEDEQRLSKEIETHRAQQTEIGAQVDATEGKLQSLEETFENAERTRQRSRGDLDSARKSAIESNRELAQRSARLDAVAQLVASGEGFAKGTQNLLSGLDTPKDFLPHIQGVLADFLQVEDAAAKAIEAALGMQLQTVIVSDSNIAETLITRLTQKKLGQAALLPKNYVKKSNNSQMETVPAGATAWALDKVKVAPEIAEVVEDVLKNTLIVPDLATAMRLRADYAAINFVTENGELLSSQGIIHGGASAGKSTSVLERQNEVRSLKREVSELKKTDEKVREKVTTLEAQLEAEGEAVEIARERLQKQKVTLSTLKGQLSLANREVENFKTRIDNVRWEAGELKKREDTASDSRKDLESELKSARERLIALETETSACQAKLNSAISSEQEFTGGLNDLRTKLAVEKRAKQAAEEQQRPMEARLSELREIAIRRESENENFLTRIQTSSEENEKLAHEIEDHTVETEDLSQALKEKGAGRDSLVNAIEEAENQLGKLRKELAAVNEQKGREEISATKLDLRLENLLSSTEDRHQIVLANFEPDTHLLLTTLSQCGKTDQASAAQKEDSDIPDLPGEPDWSEVEQLVQELKRKIESMGPVNTDAIEEYDELEERHDFLRNQHDDLTSSKTELLNVIERINDETQRRFSETFAQVRINFRDMFKELFGEKGQADLTLLDEGDPLESGIEVIAKPPGKKLQSITLLSGGERSMTAVALLFSIYMIKPSPFCVLDELDAPLDESNINRFVKVLDRFIDNSQFIIVTHSKRTMARADVMYGVTMEEFGVSKPVGMRLTASSMEPKESGTSAAQKAALRLDA